MLDMTLEQGQQVFLNALSGNNFSGQSIRAYNADITQFIEFLQSIRVDWNNPLKISRLDIVEFMNRLAGLEAHRDDQSPQTGIHPALSEVSQRE